MNRSRSNDTARCSYWKECRSWSCKCSDKRCTPYVIVAGNPAKLIKRITPKANCSAYNAEDEAVQLGLDSCGE